MRSRAVTDRPRRWWGSPRAVGVAGAVRSRIWECFIRTVFPRYPLENILNTWKFRYQSFQTRKSLALNDGAAGAAAQRPPCKRKNKSASGISLKKKKREVSMPLRSPAAEKLPAERLPCSSRELFNYWVCRWPGCSALGDFAAGSLGRILNGHPLGEAAQGRSHVDGLASRGCRGRGREVTTLLPWTPPRP